MHYDEALLKTYLDFSEFSYEVVDNARKLAGQDVSDPLGSLEGGIHPGFHVDDPEELDYPDIRWVEFVHMPHNVFEMICQYFPGFVDHMVEKLTYEFSEQLGQVKLTFHKSADRLYFDLTVVEHPASGFVASAEQANRIIETLGNFHMNAPLEVRVTTPVIDEGTHKFVLVLTKDNELAHTINEGVTRP